MFCHLKRFRDTAKLVGGLLYLTMAEEFDAELVQYNEVRKFVKALLWWPSSWKLEFQGYGIYKVSVELKTSNDHLY